MAAPYHPPAGAAALSPLARSLALDPVTAQRLAAESLQRARPRLATIIAFAAISPRMTGENCGQTTAGEHAGTGLEAAALEYLRHPAPPNGHAKALATARGLNYGSLLTKICLLRQSRRFA